MFCGKLFNTFLVRTLSSFWKKKCQAISYFSEQEYYYLQFLLLLLQRLSIHPSQRQTDHQKFILLHIAFPMYKCTNEQICLNWRISGQTTICLQKMHNARFTLAKSRWRWKTHMEAYLYAVGQRSTNRRTYLVLMWTLPSC